MVIMYLVSLILLLAACDAKSVNTPVGTIVGMERKLEFAGNKYTTDRYLGIPYAEPPVGDLRFRMPVSKSDFTEPYEAKSFGAACLQYSIPGVDIPRVKSEDCLFLNVFVPTEKPDQEAGYAVMVFIHGGGFMVGSGDVYVGDTLAAFGNVIVVTINYRLGIFGFLTNLDEYAPANIGAWDQQLAIKWVNKNIKSFGGDDARVTIFGESAGSMSSLFQSLLPENKGLFQRVIAQSGSPTLKYFSSANPSATIEFVAETFECDKTDIQTIIACLRKLDADAIIDKLESLGTSMEVLMKLQFSPMPDDKFIKVAADVLMEEAKTVQRDQIDFYRSLDIMFGTNSHEGGLYIEAMSGTKDIESYKPTSEEMRNNLLPTSIYIATGKPASSLVTNIVSALYTDWSNPEDGETLRDQYTSLLGDVWFIMPTVSMARTHTNASSGRSFVYMFTPRPTFPLITSTPSWLQGANHADDLMFVFGFDEESRKRLFRNKEVPQPADWETDTAADVMRYWTNFAKSGDPSTGAQNWPEYDIETQQYMEINKGQSNVKKYFFSEKVNLWLDILPEAMELIDTTVTSGDPKPGAEEGSCSADGGCDGA